MVAQMISSKVILMTTQLKIYSYLNNLDRFGLSEAKANFVRPCFRQIMKELGNWANRINGCL